MKGARNLLRALPPGADAPWGLPVSARTIQEHCPACQRTAQTASPSCVPSAEQRINPGLIQGSTYIHVYTITPCACLRACVLSMAATQTPNSIGLHISTTPRLQAPAATLTRAIYSSNSRVL
jgi:hypothetical protein